MGNPSRRRALWIALLIFAGIGCAKLQIPQQVDEPLTAIQASAGPGYSNAILPPPVVTVATTQNAAEYADPPVARRARIDRVPNWNNAFYVTVTDIARVHAEQQSETLCWAACTQMVLAQHDEKADQAMLGARFRPDKQDKSANVGIIMRALNPDLDAKIQGITMPIQLVPISSDQMIAQLLAGDLVVAGLVEDPEDPAGHACIVCGATIAKLKNAGLKQIITGAGKVGDIANLVPEYGLYAVQLFDPEPGVGSRELTGEAFRKQVRFITSRPLAREAIESTMQKSTPKAKGSPIRNFDWKSLFGK